MPATIGIKFNSLNNDQANELRRRLNELAELAGYKTTGGRNHGKGSASALLEALARGEITIAIPDDGEQRYLKLEEKPL